MTSSAAEVAAGRLDDERRDELAPLLVGDADHGDLGDVGVLEDGVLDLDRRDVLAAGDDDVLLAVRDRDVAELVDRPAVAGVEPAVDDRPRRRLGLLPVALHHDVAAGEHLALVVDGHLAADRRRRRPGSA